MKEPVYKKVNRTFLIILSLTVIFNSEVFGLRAPIDEKNLLSIKDNLSRSTKNSAANLYLTSGQVTNEPKKLKLQLVLKALLRNNEGAVTVENVTKEAEALMRAHNAIQEPGDVNIKILLDELTLAGLLRRENNGYIVEDSRTAAVWANDWEYIRSEIEAALNNTGRLKDLLLDYEKVCIELWPNDLKERFDPILIAVCMLSRKFDDDIPGKIKDKRAIEKKFIKKIAGIEKAGADFYNHPIFDAARFTLLRSSEIPVDWSDRYASNLEGATIVNVAAEVSSLRGGLGRVLFFDTAASSLLLGQKAKLVSVEPYYTDLADYGITINEDSLYRQFTMQFRGQAVNVKVYKIVKTIEIPDEKGNNIRVNVDDFFITDEQHRFVCRQYSYSKADSIASDDEFSEFFSRAAIEFTNIMAAAKDGEGWGKAILNVHDGQCLPAAFFKSLFYAQNPEKYKALAKIPIVGKTHTYPNRIKREFDNLNDAGRFLEDTMNIPREYHWICLRKEGTKHIVDFTSMGLRTCNLPLAVSTIQRFEMNFLDPSISLESLTNGDFLSYTSKELNKALRDLYGEDVDVVHLKTEQIIKVKKVMVKKLYETLINKRKAEEVKHEYHVHGYLEGLNPNQLIIEYAGRLVIEKIDLEGQRVPALTLENTEERVREGAQIVIFGNLQQSDPKSVEFTRKLRDLAQKIGDDKGNKGKDSVYKGTLIFVDKFVWDEQLILLVAALLQAQCSWRYTGAAELTESNPFVALMLQLTTIFHEGITDFGIPLDWTMPGKGTTIRPHANTKEAYMAVFEKIDRLFREDRTAYAEYQKTAKLISRALNVIIKESILIKKCNELLKNSAFDNKPEPRNDIFTEKGLELAEKGICIERLNPGDMYLDSAQISKEVADGYMAVEISLLIAPGVKMPDVTVRSNSYNDDWENYTVNINRIDRNRIIYKANIPVKNGNKKFKLVWKIGDVWLGTFEGKGNIDISGLDENTETVSCL